MERHATCSAGHWAKCFCWSLDGGLVSALPSPTCNYFLRSACVETTCPAGHAAHCFCWSLDGALLRALTPLTRSHCFAICLWRPPVRQATQHNAIAGRWTLAPLGKL